VLNLAWPWLLVLLPLPLAVHRLMPAVPRQRQALRAPLYTRIAARFAAGDTPRANLPVLLLMTLTWVALVLALARPQWIGEPVALPTSGRDLLIAVDISDSMRIEDMVVGGTVYPRLGVVKDVVGDFVQQRKGDRLGLILFGSQAYLQVPLTFDRRTVHTMLNEARTGFAGPATAIGDAIGIAIKRLASRPENTRVLILLSDGSDTASELPPAKAVELAANSNIRIHTIGVSGDPRATRSLFGLGLSSPSANVDEDTLRDIAELTGGRFFRARNPQQLQEIYATLNEIEPVPQEDDLLRPTADLFYWPLTVAFLAFLGLIVHTGAGRRD